jgi:hypothetical protein
MLFLGQPGGMADRKKKAESVSNRLFLIFFATFFNQVKKVEDK